MTEMNTVKTIYNRHIVYTFHLLQTISYKNQISTYAMLGLPIICEEKIHCYLY